MTLPPHDLLGHSFQSGEVQALVAKWQQLEYMDEDDVKKAVLDHRLSVISRETGLYLFFTDEESYRQRFGSPKTLGSLVLERLVFLVAYEENFSQYSGTLPGGLRPEMTFDDVARVLGSPAKSWAVSDFVAKARWIFQGQVVDVSFCPDKKIVRLLALTPSYSAQWDSEKRSSSVTPEAYITMLGMPLDEFLNQEKLTQFDLESRKNEIGEYKEADCSAEFGIEFFFKVGSDFSSDYRQVRSPNALHFSGVRYRSDFDFSSCGFNGPMPFGLELDDPWNVIASKVNMPVLKEECDSLDGYQLWSFEDYELHVLSSFLEDRIFRITLDAKGCQS